MTMTETDPNPLFALLAKLDLTIGRHTDQLQQVAQREMNAARLANVPESVLRVGSGTAPSNGVLIVKLGGPTQGYRWNVRRLVIGGLQPTVTAAGRGDVYVTAQPLDSLTAVAQMVIQEWVDTTSTLPAVAFYGEGEQPLRYPEKLFVVFSGATNAQEYAAAAMVQNVQDSANAQRLAV